MPIAITFSRYGDPDVLTVSQVELPQPGPGQVRVRVRAASVNPIDAKIRSGMMEGIVPAQFPVFLGLDVSGVVDAAGADASAAVGDEVFGVVSGVASSGGSGDASGGGYAEYAILGQPVAKPERLSWELAAALPVVGTTAFRVLKQLGVHSGETLLIHGAGGSVGTIAVQLAVARGITVIATAGEHDHERLATLGATPVAYGDGWMDRVKTVAPNGVDAVFDAAGAGVLAHSVGLTGDRTRVITIADITAAVHDVRLSRNNPADRSYAALPELADLATSGKLTLPIWRTYPLAEAAQAHADLEARSNRGKIVLLP
ncbi:NADP-dependent oxidoreductase [Streptomyces roseochromogenus]|uniref:Enoyl reductase (ER) domain-containing protein n=1 Tax=Streptomyces roseochromogenus subsp. oscitans DS 12.976 TaxID=1352936 RepID=V6JFI5_STRRC|nr:NADP-dependent oxidoreductase [Streptomyces roseochromogenus]EST18468.1 hypothetical protein M878_44940 [Streptomyces roseochromogenus subsp. oscitans DS 12.976]